MQSTKPLPGQTEMKQWKTQDPVVYARGIHNKTKRAYALAWIAYCRGEGSYPERPLSIGIEGVHQIRKALAERGVGSPPELEKL